MIYHVFVILHILSAGVVIGLIALAVIGTVVRKGHAGTPRELESIRSDATLMPIMAMVGSIGLLVSGVVLTLLDFSFFPFSSLPWLALMQTDFIVIMAISGAVLAPNGKKILALADSELSGAGASGGASEELRRLVRKQYSTQLIVALLVVIAVALGESKALMWAIAG
ncbi:MAG: hypothetical protein ACHQNE_00970 [Candidatus Kapaibacterium sp.]